MIGVGELVHGGPDAQGVAAHDFSTNGNACGPCPEVLQALQRVDATHYPDPTYTALRESLAALHRVQPARIVMAASASEFIFRITAAVAQRGGSVQLPPRAYGDYARAAAAYGLAAPHGGETAPRTCLVWGCEPSSPLGQSDPDLQSGHWLDAGPGGGCVGVLDRAYEPLRLGAPQHLPAALLDRVWQLWTPNKALGLTGIRAAYAIAPRDAQPWVDAVEALAPSWPIGSHGVVLLDHWARGTPRAWLARSLRTLREWKVAQRALCADLGWSCLASEANFFCAQPPVDDVATLCAALRSRGVKLRDTASLGLPGHVRLGVRSPASQAALADAWRYCH